MTRGRKAIRLIYDVRFPIVVMLLLIALSIANSKFAWQPQLPATISMAYLLLRLFVVAFAGYLATSRTRVGLLGAAFAGAIVLLAESLVVAGWFLSIDDWPDVARVAGTFAIVVWAAMGIAVAGGLVGRLLSRRRTGGVSS